LTSGHPQLGDTPTRLILIASIPLVIIFFVLAIRNSQSNP
jgi:Na+/H+-dicarboxylate symporter